MGINQKINNQYPFYLHNNIEFVDYWKRYFDKYPLQDTNRFEIYIDFPFCRSLCKFCAFGTNIFNDYKDRIKLYEDAVISIINDMKDIIPSKIDLIYFGGGTPPLWSRESLKEIASIIPGYNNATCRTMEVHPIDLTDEFLDFIINDINIKTISIGIQSFDLESNKMQNRIPCDINKLKHAIDILHKNNRYVNIDIVALFNYYDEHGWDIYRDDMEIAINELHPDDICSIPNFRVPKYYVKSIRFREILKDITEKYPEYKLEHSEALSTNINDIISYGEEPYHLLRNDGFYDFYRKYKVAMDSNVDILKNNIIMGFGGSINNHTAISRLGIIQEDINSYFDFKRNRIIHRVKATRTISKYDGKGIPPSIRICNCEIDPTINDL